MINFDHAFGMEQKCVPTTCNRYTQRYVFCATFEIFRYRFTLFLILYENNFSQVVRHLWNTPKYITPLGKQLAQVLSRMSRVLKEADPKLNTISAQTLWAVGVYSQGECDNFSISCVFEKVSFFLR